MLTANQPRFESLLRAATWKAAFAGGSRLNRNLCLAAGTIAGFPRDSLEVRTIAWGSAVDGRQIRFQYESLTAGLCLGMAVAGVSTLIGIGLVIAFA